MNKKISTSALKRAMRTPRKDTYHLNSGEWFPWRKKGNEHICCNCGYKHIVDVKVDKRGRVWMRWTRKQDVVEELVK